MSYIFNWIGHNPQEVEFEWQEEFTEFSYMNYVQFQFILILICTFNLQICNLNSISAILNRTHTLIDFKEMESIRMRDVEHSSGTARCALDSFND